MSELFGDKRTFAFEVDRLHIDPALARSSAARTAARLRVWCAGQNLCAGRDGEGAFDAMEVPLIDLATWLVEGWDERIFDSRLPGAMGQFKLSVPIAGRWRASAMLALSPGDADALYRWAMVRGLEFAASDYLLPNVMFDRVDDDMRVSWDVAEESHGFVDTLFAPAAGTVLVAVDAFVDASRRLIEVVAGWAGGENGDYRARALHSFLELDAVTVGATAFARWAPKLPSRVVPETELARVGRTGRGGAVAAFLRSAEDRLSADVVEVCLTRLGKAEARFDVAAAERLRQGAESSIDPREPWTSGYALAQHVRRCWAEAGVRAADAPVPIEEIVAGLGVEIHRVDLGVTTIEGVCLLDDDRRAVAVLNTFGRLGNSRVRQRSTLAHELCHFLFDAPRYRTLGQADVRAGTDSPMEKRANAFAAELLLPRAVIARVADGAWIDEGALGRLAARFRVGVTLARAQAQNAGFSVMPA